MTTPTTEAPKNSPAPPPAAPTWGSTDWGSASTWGPDAPPAKGEEKPS